MPCKRPRRAAERLSHSGCRARQFPHHRTLRFFRFQLSAALLVHSFLRFSFVRVRSWPCLSVSACRYSVRRYPSAPENRQSAARWRVRPGVSEDSAWIRLNRFEVSAPGVERFARARRPSWHARAGGMPDLSSLPIGGMCVCADRACLLSWQAGPLLHPLGAGSSGALGPSRPVAPLAAGCRRSLEPERMTSQGA